MVPPQAVFFYIFRRRLEPWKSLRTALPAAEGGPTAAGGGLPVPHPAAVPGGRLVRSPWDLFWDGGIPDLGWVFLYPGVKGSRPSDRKGLDLLIRFAERLNLVRPDWFPFFASGRKLAKYLKAFFAFI